MNAIAGSSGLDRTYDYKSEVVQISAAAGQLYFNPQQLMSDYVSLIHLTITNAAASTNNDVGRFTRFQIAAGGVPIFTWTLAQLRSYIQRYSRSNWTPSLAGDTLTIPMSFLNAPTLYDRDACQFPKGAGMSLSIQYGANGSGGAATGTGLVMVSYTFANREPDFYPVFKTDQMAISPGPVGGISNGVYPFSEPGRIQCISLTTTGIHELRLQLSGRLVMKLPGPANLAAPGNLLRESQQMDSGTALDPLTIDTPFGLNANYEKSFLQLDVANSWAGAANELGICALRDASTPLTMGSR